MPVPKGVRVGGRKPGTPNKVTAEKRALMKQLIPDGDDPISFWMQLLKNKDTPLDIRLIVARDVAPYRHPKLASIEARTGGKTHEQRLAELQRMEEDGDGMEQ